jgi:hypothetical protein
MKAKLIMCILTVLIICWIFFISYGADRFYYGTSWVDPERDFPLVADSLYFNIVRANADSATIDSFANYSLRALVSNPDDEYSPYKWASQSHYTLWEAEGYPGSYYGFTYAGGSKVWDPYASGDTAMLFSVSEHDSGLIQTGPGYNQERKNPLGQDIEYTAEFQLKSPDYSPPHDTVCILMVVGKGGVLADSVIFSSQFTDSLLYEVFEIHYYATQDSIQFQIYWMGNRTLYIDYVKAYDDNGWQLVDQGWHNQGIMDYVSEDWVHTTLANGDTVVYRWYLQNEPWYVDLLEPARYIDSLLREKSTERLGYQIVGGYSDETFIHEYFLRHDPEQYFVEIYPTQYWGLWYSGSDFQAGVDSFTMWLNNCKNQAEDYEKDFWVTIQTHFWGNEVADSLSCQYGPAFGYGEKWYCSKTLRAPTGNEVRLQTFMALCYGVDAISHFNYSSWIDDSNPSQWRLRLGLYDHIADTPTEMWYEIAHFSGPRVELLGPKFQELTWQGAGFYEDVSTITGSFIDSLKPAPGESLLATYVEIGFFKDDADTDYFMLVNRQCLENEDQSVIAYLDSAILDGGKMWYVIDQYSQDTTFTGAINGSIPFTTHLEPGEGKLFKLVPFPDSAFHGTARPLNWQGGIMLDGTFK